MKTQFKLLKKPINYFLTKTYRKISLMIFSAILLSSVLLTSFSSVNALSPEANGDNPLKIVIEPSLSKEKNFSEDMESSKPQNQTTQYPDLGDDQVFPFAAGLDSY